MPILSIICLIMGVSGPPIFATADSGIAHSRKILFFDLSKFDYWDNVELRQGEPKWIPDGTYVDQTHPRLGMHFPTVWQDEESGKWRMVHSLQWSPFKLMACESDDGITWNPLPIQDANPDGGKLAPNHVFTLPSGSGSHAYQDPNRTDGYRFRIFGRQDGEPVVSRALADPQHRWHEAAKEEGRKRYISEAVTMVSEDGVHWELKTGGKWDWGQSAWFPEPPVFAFWNQAKKQHTMLVRPGWGDRRQCIRFSDDLKTWSDPELLFQSDALDTNGPIGQYGMPVIPVGNGAGFVGLLWIFHNSNSEPVNSFNQFYGTMDAELVFSYDGVRFVRGMRDPFLKLNPIPEPGCSQIRVCSIVETKDEIYIYSEGHRSEHGHESSDQKKTDESLGTLLLHTLRKDGWMYLRSQGDWARVQTKPFTLFEPGITINTNAQYGELRFQLTDEKSQPIEGFTFDDCLPISRDNVLNANLTWKQANLSTVTNKVLRLEVKFRNANIYSLAMNHHFLDAQDQWLIKDGKPIDHRLFDY